MHFLLVGTALPDSIDKQRSILCDIVDSYGRILVRAQLLCINQQLIFPLPADAQINRPLVFIRQPLLEEKTIGAMLFDDDRRRVSVYSLEPPDGFGNRRQTLQLRKILIRIFILFADPCRGCRTLLILEPTVVIRHFMPMQIIGNGVLLSYGRQWQCDAVTALHLCKCIAPKGDHADSEHREHYVARHLYEASHLFPPYRFIPANSVSHEIFNSSVAARVQNFQVRSEILRCPASLAYTDCNTFQSACASVSRPNIRSDRNILVSRKWL